MLGYIHGSINIYCFLSLVHPVRLVKNAIIALKLVLTVQRVITVPGELTYVARVPKGINVQLKHKLKYVLLVNTRTEQVKCVLHVIQVMFV